MKLTANLRCLAALALAALTLSAAAPALRAGAEGEAGSSAYRDQAPALLEPDAAKEAAVAAVGVYAEPPAAAGAASARQSTSQPATARADAGSGASNWGGGDQVPPELFGLTPANGSLIGSAATFSFGFSDAAPSSGIDHETVMLHIDNRHQHGCTLATAGFSCQKSGLSEGQHKIEAFACDTEFNCSSATWHVRVDATAPAITGLEPTGTVNSADVTLAAAFDDGAGAGVDPAAATITLDGVDQTAACVPAGAGVSCTVKGLADGSHAVRVEAADRLGNKAARSWSFLVDTAAIGITGQLPAPGSWQTSSRPQIKADFLPLGLSVIDTEAVTLRLDGADVSGGSQRQSAGVSFTPEPLAEGWHTVSLTVSDSGGHQGGSEWSFAVDTLAPEIIGAAPSGDSPGGRPLVSAAYADGGSGIDATTVELIVDGANVTDVAQLGAEGIAYQPPEELAPGSHSVQLTLRDLAGNRRISAWSFAVAQRPAPPAQPGKPLGPATVVTTTVTEYLLSYSLPPVLQGSWFVTGFRAFPTTYLLPWYDSQSGGPGFKDEIVVGNRGGGDASATIFIAGELKWSGKIAEGGSASVWLPAVKGGPVKIICPTGQPLEVIHRLSQGDGSASQAPAVEDDALEAELVLPWLEPHPGGGSSAVVIANAGAEPAEVELLLGDPERPESRQGRFTIAADTALRTSLGESGGGPVRIVSLNRQPLLAAIESETQGSRAEALATGLSGLSDRYLLDAGPGSWNGVRLWAASPGGKELRLEIRAGGQPLSDPENPESDYFLIPRQGARALDLAGAAGPVEVLCANCSLGEGPAVAVLSLGGGWLKYLTAVPGSE